MRGGYIAGDSGRSWNFRSGVPGAAIGVDYCHEADEDDEGCRKGADFVAEAERTKIGKAECDGVEVSWDWYWKPSNW